MKSSPKLRPNGWDALVVLAVVLLAAGCAWAVWGGQSQGTELTAVVSVDGVEKERLPLKKADGTEWTTVPDSGGQNAITVYEHGPTLHVRGVIAVAQLYQLSWKVMEGDTEITDTGIAGLAARSGDVYLGRSPGNYAVNTPVTFKIGRAHV